MTHLEKLLMPNSFQSGKYTIDRFEGKQAVLLYRENESIEILAPRKILPDGIEEGSILQIDIIDGSIQSVVYLKKETAVVRKRNVELLQELVKKNRSF
jgi:hypothetical protein